MCLICTVPRPYIPNPLRGIKSKASICSTIPYPLRGRLFASNQICRKRYVIVAKAIATIQRLTEFYNTLSMPPLAIEWWGGATHNVICCKSNSPQVIWYCSKKAYEQDLNTS